MAIIACPECGQQVSTTAKACPGCGHAVADTLKYKSRQKGCGIVLVAVVSLVGVAIVTGDKQPTVDKPRADPLTGETWYTKGSPIGCRDSKDLDRLGDLARQNDNAAFAAFYLRQTLAGKCTKLDDGTQVYIESSSLFGAPCVRPKGDPFCLYVLKGLLQNAPRK